MENGIIHDSARVLNLFAALLCLDSAAGAGDGGGVFIEPS